MRTGTVKGLFGLWIRVQIIAENETDYIVGMFSGGTFPGTGQYIGRRPKADVILDDPDIARAEYDRAMKAAYAERERITAAADIAYRRVTDAAYVEYHRKREGIDGASEAP